MTAQKSVLITGCSWGGIGHALAKEYHAQGFRVFATARRLEAMSDLEELGIETFKLDITDSNSITTVRDEVARQTGGTLNILVNNAGIVYSMPATDISLPQVRAMFETNLFGVMAMVQAFIHLLIASSDGRIVNMSSLAAVFAFPYSSAYAASKGALVSYGDTLRVELRPFRVKVMTILAGAVKTNICAAPRTLPLDSLYQPVKQEFEQRGVDRALDEAIPAVDFARMVVRKTTGSRFSAWFWCGPWALMVWFVTTFFCRTASDWQIARHFGLNTIPPPLQVKKDE